MSRLWQLLTNRRFLLVLGLLLVGTYLFLGLRVLLEALLWGGLAIVLALACWGLFWLARYGWHRRAALRLAASVAPGAGASDSEDLRKRLREAVNTIKTSKLGLNSGAAALYELPWYIVIGKPAAGKSSVIANAGLHFPLAAKKAVQGVAGTRNCDWFFTSEGILLDTAGRYAISNARSNEWFGFLAMLRKVRPRAPINGILIAVSVAELASGDPQESVELAKSLRTRVQELTERLGVFAPVYVVFTKVDLVAGFGDFFRDADSAERQRTWGATIRYNRRSTSTDVLAFFDRHFDELHDGLKEMSLASMGGNRSVRPAPGVFTFPHEFAAIKAPLRAFLATLFDENTYQFKPVFRGFYFASALQEGMAQELAPSRVASRFELTLGEQAPAAPPPPGGYFLHDLFRTVIFPDKGLVARYTTPHATRWKIAAFIGATLLLGGALGAWSWSAQANRTLVNHVRADFAHIAKLRASRNDLQSRLQSMEILQDRIEQLDRYHARTPLMLTFGLYQGETVRQALRREYFNGARQLMLRPAQANLEAFLAEVNANGALLGQATPAAGAAQIYQDESPTRTGDAYNALKAYLMLGEPGRADAGHLNDQLTRFWRGWLEARRGAMPREQMIRSAERLITFYLAQSGDAAWPRIAANPALIDAVRQQLRRAVGGKSARERVYADIKRRADTRYPATTVARLVGEADRALIGGSHAVPGSFSRAAFEGYVSAAITEVTRKEQRSSDWVLNTAFHDDLTLEGSPEQVRKALVEMYKTEYALEWNKLLQGAAVSELRGFDGAVLAMNRLGDPQTSPLARLLRGIDQETAWDNPAPGAAGMAKVERGVLQWFRETILRRAPAELRSAAPPLPAAPSDPAQMGQIAREFAGLARLVGARDKNPALLGGYLDNLSRLRVRLNQLKNQGDPGPGARQFMQQTLEGSGSELADTLKYVDEQMLVGMNDSQKQVLRPLLVRPLVQTFAMIVLPVEAEINKTWQLQVAEPFERTLAAKGPFSPSAPEASAAEIALLFGPDGQIAKFVGASMGALVVRRGDVLAPRTWAELGITLTPAALVGFPRWIGPLTAAGAPREAQTVFQLQGVPATELLEYLIEVDGQQMRYRNNSPPVWTSVVHPGPGPVAGARIVATGMDGRVVELFNEPGPHGLKRMIDGAISRRKNNDVFELRWTRGSTTLAVDLKIIATPDTPTPDGGRSPFRGLRLPHNIAGRAP